MGRLFGVSQEVDDDDDDADSLSDARTEYDAGWRSGTDVGICDADNLKGRQGSEYATESLRVTQRG